MVAPRLQVSHRVLKVLAELVLQEDLVKLLELTQL